MGRIGQFLKEVAREMKKVSWPKSKDMVRFTITVISTIAFFAVFFAVIDFGISSVIELILK
ncbi:MAG: preprotein translocase subunit SecE [Bacillales bacterium]|jgi:preprotein translocase subunit SecE|nr:preprotein translocase subunit SecE [Bacillales bacterium]